MLFLDCKREGTCLPPPPTQVTARAVLSCSFFAVLHGGAALQPLLLALVIHAAVTGAAALAPGGWGLRVAVSVVRTV